MEEGNRVPCGRGSERPPSGRLRWKQRWAQPPPGTPPTPHPVTESGLTRALTGDESCRICCLPPSLLSKPREGPAPVLLIRALGAERHPGPNGSDVGVLLGHRGCVLLMNSPGFAFKIAVSTALQPHKASPIHRSLAGVDRKPALRARRDRKAVTTPEITRRKQNEGIRPPGDGKNENKGEGVAPEAGSQRSQAARRGPGGGRPTEGRMKPGRAGGGGVVGSGPLSRGPAARATKVSAAQFRGPAAPPPPGGWPVGGLSGRDPNILQQDLQQQS